jgi:hypothetical protein
MGTLPVEKDESSTVDVAVVKRKIELFEDLSDADYARLCKEQIAQEAIIAECVETIEMAKSSVKGALDDAKRECERIHGIIATGKERKEIDGEIRFNWKSKTAETWRTDGLEPVHIEKMDRIITDEEMQTKLHVPVVVSIHGNAQTRTVTLASKELVVLESFRALPYSQEHFSWGTTSQETKQLAAAILLKYLPKEKAELLVDAFADKMLGIFPKDKDLDLTLDMDKWISVNTVEGKTAEEKPKKKGGKHNKAEVDYDGPKPEVNIETAEGSDQ